MKNRAVEIAIVFVAAVALSVAFLAGLMRLTGIGRGDVQSGLVGMSMAVWEGGE